MSIENGLKSDYLFDLGRTVMSGGIYNLMITNRNFVSEVLTALTRHSMADWGDLSDNDKALNDSALKSDRDGRMNDYLMSSYHVCGYKVNIKTEYDHSVTTIYLPEED